MKNSFSTSPYLSFFEQQTLFKKEEDIPSFSPKNSYPPLMKLPSRQQKATYHILTTPGFVADSVNDRHKKYGSKGEVQGNEELRKVVAKATKNCYAAISAGALREQKEVNPEQYLTLTIKRFSHAYSLQGLSKLPSGKQINREGFSEVFTKPMLNSSFKAFYLKDSFLGKKDKEWITNHFNRTFCHDSITERQVVHLTEKIQRGDFKDPVLLATGYDWHSTITIFWGPFLIYGNRGRNSLEGGINIFRLPDLEKVTQEKIIAMVYRQQINQSNDFNHKKIVEQLEGELIYTQHMSFQQAGICTYTSMKIGIYVLMVIRRLRNQFSQENRALFNNMEAQEWEEIFQKVKPIYKKWIHFDRKIVFDNFKQDIEEVVNNPSIAHRQKLKKMYAKILDAWLDRYMAKHCDHVKQSLEKEGQTEYHYQKKIISVQNLLKNLNKI